MATIFATLGKIISVALNWFLEHPSVNVPLIMGTAFLSANALLNYLISPFVDFVQGKIGSYESVVGHLISEFTGKQSPFIDNIIYAGAFDEFLQILVDTLYFTIGIVIQVFLGFAAFFVVIFSAMAAQYAANILSKSLGKFIGGDD